MKPYFESKHCTLYHGDCLEIMPELAAGSVDLILCDLPYGTTACSWDTVIPFEFLWGNYWKLGKENAAIVLTAAQPFATDLIKSQRKYFRYDLIWEKTTALGFLDANRRPLRSHELVLIFTRNTGTYNPQKETGYAPQQRTHKESNRYEGYSSADRKTWDGSDGTRYPRSVIKISNHNGALWGQTNKTTKHPTQKPVPLMEYMIKTYSNEGETVLDNCFGSGTTGVACCKTNRQFIGIEMEEKYVEIAAKRIERAEIDAAQNLFLEPEAATLPKQGVMAL